MKLKSASIRVKAGPDDGLAEGQFTAYASVFGNKDSYGDVVMPGAFADTLEEWTKSDYLIPLLFGHNMSDPDYNIGSVEAKEDDHGLLVTGTLDLESPKAQQVYRLIKGRRINQMSFAYDVLEGGWAERQKSADGDETEEYFELRKLKLYEVSVVPIGANQETEILAAKAAQDLRQKASEGMLSKESLSALSSAYFALDDLLFGGGKARQEEASGKGRGKDEARERKSKAPTSNPSADALALEIEMLELGKD